MDRKAEAPARLKIGEGKISGRLSIFLALVSLGGVLCFQFPRYLTTAEFRAHYPVAGLRYVLLGCLLASFGFALASFLLGNKSRSAFVGILLSTLAIVLGGPAAEVGELGESTLSVGLDWLLIDILVLSVLFIPIELFLPQREEQTKLHPEWKTDLVYFAVSHLFVQLTAIAVRFPAESLFRELGFARLQLTVKDWPFLLQLALAVLLADLFQYAAHRAFHANRFLWRFHAVHHSIRFVDWLAGSRLHLVDVLLTRAFSYVPLYFLGFSTPVFYAYVVIVSIQSVAAHANTRIRFGWLRHVLVTPQYHQWHHSDDPAHYGKNFAIHLPVVDRLFGTYYLPGDAWPESMGLGDEKLPKGYFRQLVYPFASDPRRSSHLGEPSER